MPSANIGFASLLADTQANEQKQRTQSQVPLPIINNFLNGRYAALKTQIFKL